MRTTIFLMGAALSATLGVSSSGAADVMADAPLTAAERAVIMEMDVWGGYLGRNGDDVIGDEEDDALPLLGLGGMIALPLGETGLLQFEADGEGAFHDDGLDDDTYEGGLTGGGHLAWTNGHMLFGAFGGGGKVWTTDEEGPIYLGGAEGKVNFASGALGIQGGYIGADSEDGELFTDAYFVRGIGQVYFNGGRTMLQGDFAYANGTQDFDEGVNEDELDVYAWGIEVEHAATESGALSVYGAYEGLHLVEDSDGGSPDKLTDHTFRAGLKLRFGASGPQERHRATAFDLPNIARWQGATPAVD